MEIQTMEIKDYGEVHALWLNTPGMGLNSVDDSKTGIQRYLTRNPATCFVAREGQRIVGVILSGHDGRRGFIHHTAVDGAFRFKGIGRQLVETALAALKKEGIHKVAFVVFKRNEDGNRFWEKLGFEERTDLAYRNKFISDLELRRIDT